MGKIKQSLNNTKNLNYSPEPYLSNRKRRNQNELDVVSTGIPSQMKSTSEPNSKDFIDRRVENSTNLFDGQGCSQNTEVPTSDTINRLDEQSTRDNNTTKLTLFQLKQLDKETIKQSNFIIVFEPRDELYRNLFNGWKNYSST